METLNSVFLMNIFEKYPPFISYFIVVICSVATGLLIGWEREKSNKPAGLRTFAFVALGSTIFTLASLLISQKSGDPARIAAQIVTGIGFIGAGAVFRSGKIISGLTTAAGIWATAAIGMIFGLGFFVFGICIAFLVIGLFWLHSFIEMRSMGQCHFDDLDILIDDPTGKNIILLEDILDSGGPQNTRLVEVVPSGEQLRLKITFCHKHKVHRYFLTELANCPFVRSIRRKEQKHVSLI